MEIKLSRKTASVTGSTAGIGRAVAVGLSKAGAAVVLNGRNEEKLTRAVEELPAPDAKGPVRGIVADVSTAHGCQTLIDAVPEVDILVSNAAFRMPQPVFDDDDRVWLVHSRRTCLPAFVLRGITCPAWSRVAGDGSSLRRVNRALKCRPTWSPTR